MKQQLFTFYILTVLFLSCKSPDKESDTGLNNSTIAQIENLTSDQEKSDFLQSLWKEDQGTRKGEGSKIVAKHGYSSDEHQAYIRKMQKVNQQVFSKLKIYLELHGYPERPANYHELAINAFPIIIGHNHHFDQQKELLPYLYEAYKKGHCSLEDVVWVLGEMHESKFNGERYKMKTNSYTTQQEFEALNKALNLTLMINN